MSYARTGYGFPIRVAAEAGRYGFCHSAPSGADGSDAMAGADDRFANKITSRRPHFALKSRVEVQSPTIDESPAADIRATLQAEVWATRDYLDAIDADAVKQMVTSGEAIACHSPTKAREIVWLATSTEQPPAWLFEDSAAPVVSMGGIEAIIRECLEKVGHSLSAELAEREERISELEAKLAAAREALV